MVNVTAGTTGAPSLKPVKGSYCVAIHSYIVGGAHLVPVVIVVSVEVNSQAC